MFSSVFGMVFVLFVVGVVIMWFMWVFFLLMVIVQVCICLSSGVFSMLGVFYSFLVFQLIMLVMFCVLFCSLCFIFECILLMWCSILVWMLVGLSLVLVQLCFSIQCEVGVGVFISFLSVMVRFFWVGGECGQFWCGGDVGEVILFCCFVVDFVSILFGQVRCLYDKKFLMDGEQVLGKRIQFS